MFKVVIYMQDGSAGSTVTGPYEIFNYAGTGWNLMLGLPLEKQFDVRIATETGAPATLQFGAVMNADCSLLDITDADIVMISSCGPSVQSTLADKGAVIDWLRQAYANGAILTSVCTGLALLAETGLLNGKRATTHWGAADAIQKAYPNIHLVQDELFVEEDRILAGGGNYAVTDLSLHLIGKLCGETMKQNVARALLLDTRRPNQASYAGTAKFRLHTDEKIHTVQDWLEQNFRQDINLDTVASDHSMSPRNFHRRFRKACGDTPLNYLQQLRIEAAKLMLECTRDSVERIVQQVGYRDENHFRKLFRTQTGFSPLAWRGKFAVQPDRLN